MPREGEWFFEMDGKTAASIYEVDENGFGMFRARVGSEGFTSKECARRIATAVNCHAELVGLVEEYREFIKGLKREDDLPEPDEARGMIAEIDAVLTKARKS